MRTIEIDLPGGAKAAEEEYPNRYIAIPPNGETCPVTGLKHAKLYTLLKGEARGKVRVANLKSPEATRGKTLFHVGDMLRFLNKKAEENTQPIAA
jgi:hypothetical protein